MSESMLLCRVLNGVFLRVLEFHVLLRVEEPSGGRGKLVYHLEESFFSPDRKNSGGGYGVAIAESPHLFTGVRQYHGKWRPGAVLYHLCEGLRCPAWNIRRHIHHSNQILHRIRESLVA